MGKSKATKTTKAKPTNAYEHTMLHCTKFHDSYEKHHSTNLSFDEHCQAVLGISAETFGDILQEGDTGVGGANIDEYYANIGRATFCSLTWHGASKEQIE